MRVCIHLLLIGKGSKPREGNVLFGLHDGEFVSLEGFLDEVAFGCDKGFKVRKACFGELRCGKLNGDAVKVSLGGCRLGFGFRFGFNVALVNVETLVVEVFKQTLNNRVVDKVAEGKAAVLFNGEATDLVCEGGRAAVVGIFAEPLANGFYQAFAFCSCCVDCNCHCYDLLVFWYSHINSKCLK